MELLSADNDICALRDCLIKYTDDKSLCFSVHRILENTDTRIKYDENIINTIS